MHPEYSRPPGRRHQRREFFALPKGESYGVFQEVHYLPALSPWEEYDMFAASHRLTGELGIPEIVLERNRRLALMAPRA